MIIHNYIYIYIHTHIPRPGRATSSTGLCRRTSAGGQPLLCTRAPDMYVYIYIYIERERDMSSKSILPCGQCP